MEKPTGRICLQAAALIALLALSLTLVSGLAVAEEGTEPETSSYALDAEGYEQGESGVEAVVRLQPTTGDEDDLRRHANKTQIEVLDYAEEHGDVELLNRFWISNSVLVDAPEDRLDDMESLAYVERIHPNYRYSPAQVEPERDEGPPREIGHVEESKGFTVDYGIDKVNATGVWNNTKGEGTRIAILDTGVEVEHPDIELYTSDDGDPRHPGGWSEFDRQGEKVDSEPYDGGLHGTHVSGTVAGGDDSGVWIGVAPEATLLHSKVFEASGSFSQINAGLQWAVQEDADVLNLSFGVECRDAPTYIRPFIEPIQNAESTGVFVVAASGNNGEGCTSSPGNVPETLAVGAVDRFDDVAPFSSGGEVNKSEAWGDAAGEGWPDEYVVPDVVAPGVEIVSSVPGGYRQMDGTSMAAPHVAGGGALVQSATETELEPDEIRESLEATVWKPDGAPDDKDVRYGDGVVDVYDAVEHARETYDVEEDGDEEDEDIPEPQPGFGAVAALFALFVAAVLSRKK